MAYVSRWVSASSEDIFSKGTKDKRSILLERNQDRDEHNLTKLQIYERQIKDQQEAERWLVKRGIQ